MSTPPSPRPILSKGSPTTKPANAHQTFTAHPALRPPLPHHQQAHTRLRHHQHPSHTPPDKHHSDQTATQTTHPSHQQAHSARSESGETRSQLRNCYRSSKSGLSVHLLGYPASAVRIVASRGRRGRGRRLRRCIRGNGSWRLLLRTVGSRFSLETGL